LYNHNSITVWGLSYYCEFSSQINCKKEKMGDTFRYTKYVIYPETRYVSPVFSVEEMTDFRSGSIHAYLLRN